MPELPEVESVRRQLWPHVVGRRIEEVQTSGKPMRLGRAVQPDLCRRLRGRRIDDLQRRAKYLLAVCDGGETLALHLGMSGRLLWTPTVTPEEPHTHLRLRFGVDDLRMIDPRRFGVIAVRRTLDLPQDPMLRDLGPDPVTDPFDGAILAARCDGRHRAIKEVIMDQRVVAGVGNIYACEALYEARISPQRAAGRISAARLADLARAIHAVLSSAIEHGGTTLRDFAAVDGSPGHNAGRLQVFGRERQPCFRCAAPVRRITQSQRSTFFCSTCQR